MTALGVQHYDSSQCGALNFSIASTFYTLFLLMVPFQPSIGHLPTSQRGFIITAYCYPKSHNFNFEQFYRKLAARGQVIYPGKVMSLRIYT